MPNDLMSSYIVWKQRHWYTFDEPTKTRIERGQNCIAFYFRFLQDYAQIMQTRTHISMTKGSLWTCSPCRKALWTYMQSKEKVLVTYWKRKLWTCPTKTFEYDEQQQLQKNQIEHPGTTKTTFWEWDREIDTCDWPWPSRSQTLSPATKSLQRDN